MNGFVLDCDFIIQINQLLKHRNIDMEIKSIMMMSHVRGPNELQITYSDGYCLDVEEVVNGIEMLKQIPNEKTFLLPYSKQINKDYIINALLLDYKALTKW